VQVKVIVLFFSVLLGALAAHSATDIHRAAKVKINQFVKQGAIIGGQTGSGFSLLGVRRHYAGGSKVERVIFDLGDKKGEPLKSQMSFYHVSVEPKLKRVVVDLAQVFKTGLTEKDLNEKFKNSPIVEKVFLTFDPVDQNTTIMFMLKSTIAVEAFELGKESKDPLRLVLDLKKI
jgi:hypothetical protein